MAGDFIRIYAKPIPENKYSFHSLTVCEKRDYYIWLPQSHDLDAEIVKICRPHNWCYESYFVPYSDIAYHACIMQTEIEFRNDNPLIAKISLLIKLLGGE
jgi:hypothetical protein